MLKSLELFGFKSFADRTLFEFAPGITCVVGPNGSGKSNVVDAIKWILGDQSAKSLRGQEMSDVIFNGSAGRKGSGFAEAVLTFDNTNGLFGLDTAEVQIGRRLYQSGDSEYLLNNSAVRLKDIRDLFMGTGAGTAAYSIIEQGRVDQILQSNPSARRTVFEEAAGISKFKARRVDAERRLERVAQNLLRLTDIVDQAESQLTSTRSQASKAAKYQELSHELKRAWTGLAADDYRVLTASLEKSQAELESLNSLLSGVQAEAEALDERRRTLETSLSEFDSHMESGERRLSTLREALARHQGTIRHQSLRDKELASELQRVRGQRHALRKQVEFTRQELDLANEQLVSFELQMTESQQQLAAREQQLAELESRTRQRRDQTEEQRRGLSTLQQKYQAETTRISAFNSQAEATSQLLQQAHDRCDLLTEQLQTARQELTVKEELRKAAEQALQTRQSRLTSTEQAQWQTMRQREETDAQLQQLRERRSAAEARLLLLEELEQRQEGIAIGVRDILKRAQESHFPPWDRILGIVRDLLEVPMDLAPIIDAALGDRSQLIAIADMTALIDYLNLGTAPIDGRVGFISISPLSDSSLSEAARLSPDSSVTLETVAVAERDLTGQPGVFGRADRLVQARERALGLPERVLGDTWIVEHLNVARRLVAEDPAIRCVTLQGEVLSSRQLHVGIMPHESSIISRRSELRQLKNEIQQLHKSIEAAVQRQEIQAEEVVAHSEELQKLAEELTRLSNSVTEAQTHCSGQTREVQRLEREHQAQLEHLQTLSERQQGIHEEQQRIQQLLSELESQRDQLQVAIADEESALAEVRALLQETRQTIHIEQLDFAQQEERIRNLRQTQTRLERDQAHRHQQWDEAVARLAELRQTRCRTDLEILQAENQIAGLSLQREQTQRELRTLNRERQSLRESRATLLEESEAFHHQRRQWLDRRHALEFEVQKHQMQLQTLGDRIQEEYQITLQALVDSGVSAYHDFLREQYGVTAAPHSSPPPSSPTQSAPADETTDETAEETAGEAASTETGDSTEDAASAEEPNSLLDGGPVLPTFEEVRAELETRVERLRKKLKLLGNVNTDALTGLQELEQRYNSLAAQLNDLQVAKASLEDIIRRINHESQRIFLETFETIRGHFRELFRKLFGGGDADILLENQDDVLECGIEIVARPPGKELRSISLMSGGEKTMTAVGMLFAMFKSKPSPYCILDEVDAALDEANVDRYVSVLKEFVQMTQFVVITHRKRTMTAANVLYGVTMEQAGVSKRISVRFDDVRDNGEIRTAA